MTEILDRMAQSFTRRIAVHRKILTHLKIKIPPDRANSVQDDLKSTLMACTRCGEPAICEAWTTGSYPGLPAWCRARTVFERLASATGAPEIPHYDA